MTALSLSPKTQLDMLIDDILGFPTRTQKSASLVVDLRELDDKFVIEAEVPGAAKEDVKIDVDKRVLTITRTSQKTKENSGKGYYVRERESRTASRSFDLPENADGDAVEARIDNGILTVEVKKLPQSQKKQIEIKTGQ